MSSIPQGILEIESWDVVDFLYFPEQSANPSLQVSPGNTSSGGLGGCVSLLSGQPSESTIPGIPREIPKVAGWWVVDPVDPHFPGHSPNPHC